MRRFLFLLPLVLGSAWVGVTNLSAETPAAAPQSGQEPNHIIILGMDGMDSRMTSQWMDSGDLPNFAKLREQGTFAPFMPANPAQSPVSWASINTGKNPGKHGIFDFIRVSRGSNGLPAPGIGFQSDERVPLEEVDLPLAKPAVRYGIIGGAVIAALVIFFILRKIKILAILAALGVAGGGAYFALGLQSAFPKDFKTVKSLNRADEFWVELDAAGIPFRGQGTIVSYPVNELEHGKVVAGLGAPDAKGGLNTSAVYTTLKERKRMKLRRTTGEWYERVFRPAPAYSEEDAPDPSTPSGKGYSSVTFFLMEEKSPGTYHSKIFGPMNELRMQELRDRQEAILKEQQNNPSFAYEESDRIARLLKNISLLQTWVPLEVAWNKGDKEARVTVGGQTQNIALGSWSDFYDVTFVHSSWYKTRALVRIWAEADGEGLELFSSPIQIHPEHPIPGTQICWPPEFAAEIAGDIGYYETLGWACMNMAAKDGQVSDEAFVADIEFTFNWRLKMLKDAIEDNKNGEDWKVLFHFFGSPDRVCHALMKHYDEKHPQYVEENANRMVTFFGEDMPLKNIIPTIYKKMDETVGWIMGELGDDDLLLICSDHGFDSFRRQVSLNNWLAAEGFLAFHKTNSFNMPLTKSKAKSSRLEFVDWENTQAYSMAIGKIYLNRMGREREGIVSDEDADAVLKRITDALYNMTDPLDGEKIVRKVYLREEIYDGPYVEAKSSSDPDKRADGAPEITIDFAPGYRAAWKSTSGGIYFDEEELPDGEGTVIKNGPFVYHNDSPWSGDHCGVDLSVVQGIFFSSKPMQVPGGGDVFDARHIAPTVLNLMNVKVPTDYDLPPLNLQ